MKKTILTPALASAFALLSFLACEKENPATIKVELPDDIEFGKSVIYLNGEVVETYKPDFQLDTIYQLMNYVFLDTTKANISTLFAFDWLPINEGNFQLHEERIPYIKALTSISQTVNEDLPGYEYQLVDADEGFLNIEYLDTAKMEAKGRFRVKFKRTSQNGNDDLGLPEYLQFDGAFYDKVRLRW